MRPSDGARLGAPGEVPSGGGETTGRLLRAPGPRATSPRAGVAFPLPAARARAQLGGSGGARGRAARPHFSCLPPSSRAVLAAGANERREEGAGSGALRTALPRRPGRGPRAPLAPRDLASPRVRRPRCWLPASAAAAHEHSGGRTPRRRARAGAGAAASRRCGMAAEPPASLSYRTTGSTCLHPLSQLLGIPLDQVSAAGARDPVPEPGRARGGGGDAPAPPPQQTARPRCAQVGYSPCECMFFFCKCEKHPNKTKTEQNPA